MLTVIYHLSVASAPDDDSKDVNWASYISAVNDPTTILQDPRTDDMHRSCLGCQVHKTRCNGDIVTQRGCYECLTRNLTCHWVSRKTEDLQQAVIADRTIPVLSPSTTQGEEAPTYVPENPFSVYCTELTDASEFSRSPAPSPTQSSFTMNSHTTHDKSDGT